jgi:hypothetical protein
MVGKSDQIFVVDQKADATRMETTLHDVVAQGGD